MTFLDELRSLWNSGKIPRWFTVSDVMNVTVNPEAKNLSNYCVDNSGSSNKNNKVLQRRKNNHKWEYTF